MTEAARKAIDAFNSETLARRGDCLFVCRLRDKGFTDTQIADVIQVVEGVCHYCWDDTVGCQCWKDE